MRSILSLDLGTSSVGWALFELDETSWPSRLIDLGVRHFEEVVEPKGGALLNAKRRTARGMRKNLRRRRQRLDLLLGLLQRANLAPSGQDPFAESERTSDRPYELRALAIEQAIEPHEIGRALYHLARRRGFKSNRGAKLASLAGDPEIQGLLTKPEAEDEPEDRELTKEEKDEQKEQKETLAEIEGLRQELKGRTLGQYFWAEIQAGRKVRGRHTDRSMYEDEFERVWTRQAALHPNLLPDSLKAEVYAAIFHQRPLKLQKFLKTNCTLEPKKPRAERAQLIAQRFRYWQDLANLEFTNTQTGERRKLTTPEREALAARLEEQHPMSFAAVRKELKLSKDWQANLERAKADKLKGNTTFVKIRGKAPALWASLGDDGRERLVEILLTIPDRGTCYRTLRKEYGLEVKAAYDLATLELEAGTASLSARAMRRILRHMQAGLSRAEAQREAGYTPWTDEIQLLDRIPAAPSRQNMTSPRVRKALGQVRRVVNALIREYGKPTLIRIEMSREMSLNKKEKKGRDDANKLLEKENARAKEQLRALGIQEPTRADLIWYRLGEQCCWHCPYCGEGLSQQPGTGDAQIEHIVPYLRSLDDSFNNLTLSHAECNRRKGCRTPFEAFGHGPEWDAMLGRIRDWKTVPGVNHKRKLFAREEPPDEDRMVSRQLNETRWICRAAADYLRPICDIPALALDLARKHDLSDEDARRRAQVICVEATNGKATAMLRTHWGLMRALPGWESDEKTRDDLRHHALDAVAIAFTTRSLFQKLTALRKRNAAGEEVDARPLTTDVVPAAPGWLHDALRARLETVIVSHETTRNLRGALHEATALGLRDPANGIYHVRKPLRSLTRSEVDNIVDGGLREAVAEALELAGGDAKIAFIDGPFQDGLFVGPTLARRARIEKKLLPMTVVALPDASPVRYFEKGNNHHVEIFENEAGKRVGRFASTLDAARRARKEGNPVIDTGPARPGYKFVLALGKNDMVFFPEDERQYFLIESLWATNGVLQLRTHWSGNPADKNQRLLKTPNTIKAAIRVEVDAIGRVRELKNGD